MKRLIRLCAFGALGLAVPAHAQDISNNGAANYHNWSGWWGGFQVGTSQTRYDGSFSNGSAFCLSSTSGSDAFADCIAGSGIVRAETAASVFGAAATSGATSRISNGNAAATAASSASADHPGEIVGNPEITLSLGPGSPFDSSAAASAYASAPNPDPVRFTESRSQTAASRNMPQQFAYSFSEADNETESSAASAFAALGVFDLGNFSVPDQSSIAWGGHLHYDHQFETGLIFGVGADFTHMPDNGFKRSGSDDATFMLEFEDSEPWDLAISQSVDVKTETLASARLRFGHATGQFMSYFTAGAAVGEFKAKLNKTAEVLEDEPLLFASAEARSKTAVGGVVGGGVSMWLGERTVASVEGLYYVFNDSIRFAEGESVKLENVAMVSAKISVKLK